MHSDTNKNRINRNLKSGILRRQVIRLIAFAAILCTAQLFTACSDSSSAADDPGSGSLLVSVVTSGGDTSPAGYEFMVQGVGSFSTDANQEYTYRNIPEGSYNVELTQLSSHCSVTSQNPQMVQITSRNTTNVSFEIECKAILRDRIVYQSNHEGSWSIYSSSSDDAAKTRIPEFNVSGVWRPSISPDGTRIAFTATGQGFPRQQIWIMDADGTNFVNLTRDTQAHSEFPSWSPDGSKIAYHRYAPNGEGDIYVMNADGTGRTNITNSSIGDWWPTWHPDGDRLAFHSIVAGSPVYISTINGDGSGRQELLRSSSTFFRNPSWSPDGSKLAFQCNINSNIWEICVSNEDGSDPQNITNLAQAGRQHRVVSWSPDGSMLTFDSNRAGQENTYDVFIMNANGSGLVNLTNNSNSSSITPFWSPIE
ncbi:MAG: PD40 domain-containing protein [Balneolaceae bacterium]|nr:PD40 domain-containing protein [Balneolaceae bacterium]